MTRSTAGASRGASAGLPVWTSWSRTMPSSLSTTWALWPNSTGFPSRPFAIGRASGSCRLTCRVAPSGIVPASPLPGLLDDLPGRVQQVGQVVDGPDETATPPTGGRVTAADSLEVGCVGSGLPHGAFGVGQQSFGFSGRGLGQVGELGVLAPHHRQRLVFRGRVAGPQFRVQVMRPPTRRTGPVPDLRPGSSTGGPDPPTRRG